MPLTRDEASAISANASCLYGPEEVQAALDRMAGAITVEMSDAFPVVLCVMTGGIVAAGHLITRLSFPLEIDYLHATRYRGGTMGKDVRWLHKPDTLLAGRTVLVVDDILDEGHTLARVHEFCRSAGASRVRTAVLIDKQHQRRVSGVSADFVGLPVEDRYVFGFGMDYGGCLRNLNGIFVHGEPIA